MDIIWRLAPFFGLILLGVALGRVGVLNARVGGGLASYTYWVGFPVLLLHWLWDAPAAPPGAATSFFVYAGCMFVVLAAGGMVARLRRWPAEVGAGVAMTGSVGNTTFLGAPIVLSVLGDPARAMTAAYLITDCVLLTAISVALLNRARGASSPWRASLGLLTNPPVAAALVGAVLAGLRLPPPSPIGGALAWGAQFTGPVAFLVLGGLMGRTQVWPTPEERSPLGWALVLKLVAAPALVGVVFIALNISPVATGAAILMAGCPTALNAFVQARASGMFERGAVMTVVFGTAGSVLTLPLLIVLLGFLGIR
jgi:malonate transporter